MDCSHVSTHSANVESPNIDLFASRLNYQLKPYVSWMPDQETCLVDAFTLDWGSRYVMHSLHSAF